MFDKIISISTVILITYLFFGLVVRFAISDYAINIFLGG